LNAIRVHLTRTALFDLANSMIWTAMMIYQVQVIGMTPIQLVLAGTTLEVTVFLFEIPTGLVADVYSRRLSCIIGFFGIGAAYVLMGAVPAFEAIILGHFIWGVGFTFTSGAYNAWLVDEVGQDKAGNAFLRGGQIGKIASIVGIVTSIVLGSIHLQLPLLVGAGIALLSAVFLLLFMRETGFTPTPREDRNTFQKMFDTFRDGVKLVRARPMLLRILGVGIFFGLFSEGWDRLWQAHLLTTFGLGTDSPIPPIALFGGLNILVMLVATGVSEIIRRRLDTTQSAKLTQAVFWLTAIMVGSMLIFGLAPTVGIALVVWFAFVLARDLIEPLLATWTNQHIESGVRATVLSMQSQTDAIGQAVGGPPIGVVGNLSLRAGIVMASLILSPALFLLRRVYTSVDTVEVGAVEGAEA
jgi:MFS transporter, DHA3 family, tetracycline resistance protein